MNADARPRTVLDLAGLKAAGRRIVMLTCYDAAFARLLDQAGVDVLLVGDSLNQVIAGEETTLSATLDQMIYHAAAVRRGAPRLAPAGGPPVPHLPGIGPGGDPQRGPRAAGDRREGGEARGRPAHGGDRARAGGAGHPGDGPPRPHAAVSARAGRLPGAGPRGGAADRLLDATRARWRRPARAASCSSWCRPRWPQRVSKALTIPTIGIGAGPGCDGQVLVLHDMLGLNEGFSPKFLKRYAELGAAVREAVRTYADDVRDGRYPGEGAQLRMRAPRRPRLAHGRLATVTRHPGAGCATRVGAKGVASRWCPRWDTCTKATSAWWTRRAAGPMSWS